MRNAAIRICSMPSNGLRLSCRTPWTTLHRPAAVAKAAMRVRTTTQPPEHRAREPKAAGGQLQPRVVRRLPIWTLTALTHT